MRNAGKTRDGIACCAGLRGLSDSIRRMIVRSEVEGGIRLASLRDGSRVSVETLNRRYSLEMRGGKMWICGHPEFCPSPVAVKVRGSSWGGSMLKAAFLGRGMQMEFQHPRFATVTTSRIVSIRVD